MKVHQLSIAYVAEQDRILARVNTREGKELQFWFTRRVVLGMEPLIDKVVAEQLARTGGLATAHVAAMDPMSKKALSDFQRSETLRRADFATPFKPGDADETLFTSPLLVTDIVAGALEGGQVRLGFSEKLPGRKSVRSFEMGFSPHLMHAFTHLLERAVQQSNWRPGSAGASAPETASGPDRPAYLN